MKSPTSNSKPRQRRPSSSLSSRRNSAAASSAMEAGASAFASSASTSAAPFTASTIRDRTRKTSSLLLLASIALSSIFAHLLIEALDSPTPNNMSGPSNPMDNEDGKKQQQQEKLNDNGDNSHGDEALLDEKTNKIANKIIRTINSAEEDSINNNINYGLPENNENENAYNYNEKNNKEDSSSKALKTTPRKQRQKPRQKQRQRQGQETIIATTATSTTSTTQQQDVNTNIHATTNNVGQQQQQQQPQQQRHHSTQAEYDAYMRWCEKVLGIQSVVEIKEFEYPDYMQMHLEGSDQLLSVEEEYDKYDSQSFDWLRQYVNDNGEGDNIISYGRAEEEAEAELEQSPPTMPTKLVRGLAAKHQIHPGDVVISIPLYSLLSIPTTIDHDPVLSRILGPSARKKYGWTDNTAEYEIALLVIAVLYHRSLGSDSPLWHYIEILLGTSVDSFPFLWDDRELRERTSTAAGTEDDAGSGGGAVRDLARGIRQDLYQMYDEVMGALVRERPGWFAPPDGYFASQSEGGGGGGGVENNVVEWVYSYENFQWAFALVISRHHYLPIQDFDDDDDVSEARSNKRTLVKNNVDTPSQPSQMQETLSTVFEVVPPANQPTDSWVDLAKNEEHVIEDDQVTTDNDDNDDDDMALQQSLGTGNTKHSFLAPLADLINFGPPCLTGTYNAEEHAFELIATCPFIEGQEVTFWYSSDCSDVIIANFGFLHPLVPPCAPPEDWEKKSDEWEEKTKMREKELWEVYGRMDLLKEELAGMESQLVRCDCEDGEKVKSQGQQQQKQQQERQIYSMPTANTVEANHKLRNSHSLRQDFGVRGRVNEQEQATREMMEELG